MKEIKQKPAGGKPKTADAARVPKAVVKAAWLQAREAARAGEKQVVGGKDGAYSGAADTGEKGADKLVSTGERVTELAYRGGRKLAERSAGQRRERAKAAQTGGEAAQRHGAGETIAHARWKPCPFCRTEESPCVRWSTVQRSHWCSKRKNARKR